MENMFDMTKNFDKIKCLVKKRNDLENQIKETISFRQEENKKVLNRLKEFDNNLCELLAFCKENNINIKKEIEYSKDTCCIFDIENAYAEIRDNKTDLDKSLFVATKSNNIMPNKCPTNPDLEMIADKDGFIYPEFIWLDKNATYIFNKISENIMKVLTAQIENDKIKIAQTLEKQTPYALETINKFINNLHQMTLRQDTSFNMPSVAMKIGELPFCVKYEDNAIIISALDSYENREKKCLTIYRDKHIICDFNNECNCFLYVGNVKKEAILNEDGTLKPIAKWIYENSHDILNFIQNELNRVQMRESQEQEYPELGDR